MNPVAAYPSILSGEVPELPSSPPPPPPEPAPITSKRIAGSDRFSTAVAIAREGYRGDGTWPGVDSVIIASGDDRAAADPLSAAGLCWAYDAPLMLVSAGSTPASVKSAVKEIAANNGGRQVKIYIVGGTVSVPDARYSELAAAVGPGTLHKTRIAGSDRYSTAAAISATMRAVAAKDSAKAMPTKVLIANGADDTKFFDALALSPIAASKGYPILPVSASSVPAATRNELKALKPVEVIIGGGPHTVGSSAKSQLKSITGRSPQQWYGGDRYSTASAIASNAVSRNFLADGAVGVAAKLPDALTGGSMAGKKNGVLLITAGESLNSSTYWWVRSHADNVNECYVFGGTKSFTYATQRDLDSCF